MRVRFDGRREDILCEESLVLFGLEYFRDRSFFSFSFVVCSFPLAVFFSRPLVFSSTLRTEFLFLPTGTLGASGFGTHYSFTHLIFGGWFATAITYCHTTLLRGFMVLHYLTRRNEGLTYCYSFSFPPYWG